MKSKKLLLFSLLLAAPVLLTGCIKFGIGAKEGGIFKSIDQAGTWQQKILVAGEGKNVGDIGNVEVAEIVLDPQNPETIYLGAVNNGMFVTHDGAETWERTPIVKGTVSAIAVDPKDANTVFITIENKIFKTNDNGVKWTLSYLENRSGKYLTALAIDNYDHKKIYAGVSSGELIRSLDAGESWALVYDFKNKIEKILINKKDTRIIYAATQSKGLFRTADLGKTWEELNKNIKSYYDNKKFQALVQDLTKADAVIYASSGGLLKSDDGGKNWQEIKLLTSADKLKIYSLAISPKDSNEIYYSTASAIYKTKDGGKNWVTRPLASSWAGTDLLISPKDTKTIYLGVQKIKEEQSNPFYF